MTGKRLICASLFAAVLSVVVVSGDAEARCGCRGGRNVGWRQGNGYYSNGYYASNNGFYSNNIAPATSYATNTTINTQPMQQDTNYSVSKPVINQQPVINNGQPLNTAPNYNRAPAPAYYPANNPSPDVDNSAKNLTTSSIPGTQPAKAPEPAAAAAPAPRP